MLLVWKLSSYMCESLTVPEYQCMSLSFLETTLMAKVLHKLIEAAPVDLSSPSRTVRLQWYQPIAFLSKSILPTGSCHTRMSQNPMPDCAGQLYWIFQGILC